MIDYSKANNAPTKTELESVVELAREQVRLEKRIDAMKKELTEASAEYHRVRTEALPEAMRQIGLTEFALDNGAKITVKDEINVNIKESNKPAAHGWMREHGHGSIIKNVVSLLLESGDDVARDKATEFAEAHDIDYNLKESIHAATLNAWARQQLEEGNDQIPEEIINIFRYSVSKVHLPKKRAR